MTRGLAWARLVRLPNVFTALADISIGLFAGHDSVSTVTVAGLLTSSACLYSAGMAWNDYFDRDVDRRERPGRPIPSGAITPREARRFASVLSVLGLAAAAAAGWVGDDWSPAPFFHAAALFGVIMAYDGVVKSTPAGPFAMGGCRFLNVLLGFSAFSSAVAPWLLRLSAAAVVGAYVVGITLFARDEAVTSRRERLTTAAAICIVAAACVSQLPALTPGGSRLVPYAAAGLALVLAARARPAVAEPSPANVQSFVKTAILGIIPLDACAAASAAGPAGFAVVVWLLPAVSLARRLYST
jgi:4-hydroxybenzoate polyprenyltransferase